MSIRDMWRSLLRHRLGTAGLIMFVLLLVASACASLPGVPNPTRGDLLARLHPPTIGLAGLGAHPLGTDQLGRDVLSRILHGSRVTLAVGFAAVLAGGGVGITIGLIAGYFGGWIDRIFMRLVDMQLSMPMLLLALLVLVVIGPSTVNLIVVLAFTSWVIYARLVRGQVLSLREREFVMSAQAVGAPPLRVLIRHILPNIASAVLVLVTLELSRVILLEAGLSFLGMGVQPPWPSWGRMLSEGRSYMATAWWVTFFPGVAIVCAVLSVNFLGDWVRDLFDPKLGDDNKK